MSAPIVSALERKSAPPDLELTVLMPCLNEAETIVGCVARARDAILKHSLMAEVLIADNGSTDASRELAEKAGARVVSVPEPGYGAALLGGIAAARGRFVVMGDADGSYDFGDVLKFVQALRDGAELVMGCRLPSGGGTIRPGAMKWSHRWVGNPGLSALGRVLFGAPVTDFHCGMRGFSRAAIERLELRTMGMEFASEMVIKATFKKLRIAEVPIVLSPDGRSRAPHLRTFRDGWRHLRFMLLHSPTWVFLVPAAIALGLGAVGLVVILPAPLLIFGVGLDANTLLVCSLLVLTGFQWMSFGISARVFAISQGLLPPDPRLAALHRRFRLEHGIVLGLLVLAAGVLVMVRTLEAWSELHFGPFPLAIGLRRVIPAVTLIALGGQIILSSFFLSILGLKMRPGANLE